MLIFALLANLTFFLPFWGWPTVVTLIGAILSFCYGIALVIRIRNTPRSAAKYYLTFLAIVFMISYLGVIVIGGLTFYDHATDPHIAEDDLASLDWILPLIFQMAHIVVFAIIVLSEAFLARSPNVFLIIGSVLFGLWILFWFGILPMFGFWGHLLLIASLLVFVISLFYSEKVDLVLQK